MAIRIDKVAIAVRERPRDRREPWLLPAPGVATYEDIYKLTYVRGPSDILLMLAQALKHG